MSWPCSVLLGVAYQISKTASGFYMTPLPEPFQLSMCEKDLLCRRVEMNLTDELALIFYDSSSKCVTQSCSACSMNAMLTLS